MRNLERKLASLIDPFWHQGKIPGYSCLASVSGKEIAYLQRGVMDQERGTELARNTIFRIYSMTKPVISVALMQLFEKGLVKLSDPVTKFIPKWRNLRVFDKGTRHSYTTMPPSRSMTILDLLTHTSGLTYSFQREHPVDEIYRDINLDTPAESMEEKIIKLAETPLLFSPGEKWNYSVSTDVIGYLIQLIADQPLEDYVDEKICGPLEMTASGFFVKSRNLHRFSACYEHVEESQRYVLQDDPQHSLFSKPPVFVSGGGGMVSTIDDYHRFASMLLNQGSYRDARVLKPETVAMMTRNHLPGNCDIASMGQPVFSEMPYHGIGFGLGFAIMLDSDSASISGTNDDFSWGGAASTYFWIDPMHELILVFMTQLLPSSIYPFRQLLRRGIYEHINAVH